MTMPISYCSHSMVCFLRRLFRESTIAMTKHVDSYFVHERALKYTYAEFAPVAHNPCNGFLEKS